MCTLVGFWVDLNFIRCGQVAMILLTIQKGKKGKMRETSPIDCGNSRKRLLFPVKKC
jgi:hypothetical protein